MVFGGEFSLNCTTELFQNLQRAVNNLPGWYKSKVHHTFVAENRNEHYFCFGFHMTWFLWSRRGHCVPFCVQNIVTKQKDYIVAIKNRNEIPWIFLPLLLYLIMPNVIFFFVVSSQIFSKYVVTSPVLETEYLVVLKPLC